MRKLFVLMALCATPAFADECDEFEDVGSCSGNVLTYCEAGSYETIDCTSLDATCKYDSQYHMYDCLSDDDDDEPYIDCGDITYEGKCEGDTLLYCSPTDGLQTIHCDMGGGSCGADDEGGFDCVYSDCDLVKPEGECAGVVYLFCDVETNELIAVDCSGLVENGTCGTNEEGELNCIVDPNAGGEAGGEGGNGGAAGGEGGNGGAGGEGGNGGAGGEAGNGGEAGGEGGNGGAAGEGGNGGAAGGEGGNGGEAGGEGGNGGEAGEGGNGGGNTSADAGVTGGSDDSSDDSSDSSDDGCSATPGRTAGFLGLLPLFGLLGLRRRR